MREVKFRGRPTKNNTTYFKDNEWVYGSLVIEKDKYYIFRQVVDRIKRDDYIVYMIEVEPETIGQYTGLKDKNGKRIYEGDIIYIKGETELLDIKGKVEYSEEYAQFIIRNTNDTVYGAELLGDYADDIEVIGNIWDNKELLNEEG